MRRPCWPSEHGVPYDRLQHKGYWLSAQEALLLNERGKAAPWAQPLQKPEATAAQLLLQEEALLLRAAMDERSKAAAWAHSLQEAEAIAAQLLLQEASQWRLLQEASRTATEAIAAWHALQQREGWQWLARV